MNEFESTFDASFADEEIFDSPTHWVREHIQRYAATSGEEGHHWQGYTTLLLTTRGRKSGKLRRTALIYGRDGSNYLLIASQGGAPQHPNWYFNLTENPVAQIQVGAKVLTVRARTASVEEKSRLWPIMTAIYPPYDEYQARTTRDIPLVILEPL